MSETTIYLIPQKTFSPGEFKDKILFAFEKRKLIDGYYNEKYGWFASGSNAYVLFGNESSHDNSAFEYVEIHDTENYRLLPEGLQAPVTCKVCHADVRDELNDLLFSTSKIEYDSGKETDMVALELLCPNCNTNNKLPELCYNEKIALTKQYICFVAVLDEINVEKLQDVEKEIGTTFETIYGSI